MTISDPIVFTPSRRDKFKCSLFCFRNYIEDAAFFIAIVGIFITAGINFVVYKQERGFNYGPNAESFIFGTLFSIALHLGIILALITRMEAFYYPYLIVQAIGIVYFGHFVVANGYVVISSLNLYAYSYVYIHDNYTRIPPMVPYRFDALNAFVALGLMMLVQVWIFSIIWRAQSALRFERIATQFIKDEEKVERAAAVPTISQYHGMSMSTSTGHPRA